MASLYDVIKTINQVANKARDGAVDEEDQPIKAGLRREEGHPILDKRVMDGFSVSFSYDKMFLSYQTECTLSEIHSSDFEKEISSVLESVVSFIKKEYRKVQKETLSLKEVDELKISVEHINKYRTWAIATQSYQINNISDLPSSEDPYQEKLTKAIENWLSIGKK